MKRIFAILILIPAIAWGQGYVIPTGQTEVVQMNVDNNTKVKVVHMDLDNAKPDEIYAPAFSGVGFKPNDELTYILIEDLKLADKLCFQLPNDAKRCVDLKWLYLLMVAQGITEK